MFKSPGKGAAKAEKSKDDDNSGILKPLKPILHLRII
jgi:hypothetical protein